MKLHDIESIAKHFNIEYDTSAYMTNGFLLYKNIRIAEFKKDEEKIYFMLKFGLDRTYMRKPNNVFRRIVPRIEAPVEKLIETYCVPVFKELSANNMSSQHNICPGYFCNNRPFDEISANEFYDKVERTVKYIDRELTDDPKLGWNFVARAKAFNKTVLDSLTIKEYIWRIDYKKLEEEMEEKKSRFVCSKIENDFYVYAYRISVNKDNRKYIIGDSNYNFYEVTTFQHRLNCSSYNMWHIDTEKFNALIDMWETLR